MYKAAVGKANGMEIVATASGNKNDILHSLWESLSRH